MNYRDLVKMLCCPACRSTDLALHEFDMIDAARVKDGVVQCSACNAWYPIEDELLEFLTGDLSYRDDRVAFWKKYEVRLVALGLMPDVPIEQDTEQRLQTIQQQHFDWYAQNETQTYSSYEQKPLWLAVDQLTFDKWREQIKPNSLLLDLGCAQGRSTFKVMDLPIQIVGFDISKTLIRQAIERYRAGTYKANALFLAADASRLSFRDEIFDYVLIYGVLHHVPNATQTAHEVARVLKHGGTYLGSENNASMFRGIFELLQRIRPEWHEEAGPEALLSERWYKKVFENTGVTFSSQTRVFLPPHLVNRMSQKLAYQMIRMTDSIGQNLPVIKKNGGLIIVVGKKTRPTPA